MRKKLLCFFIFTLPFFSFSQWYSGAPSPVWLTSVHFISNDIGFAVGIGSNNNIIKTIDGGISWIPVNTGNSFWNVLQNYNVFFTGSNNGFVVGGNEGTGEGHILSTHDGGITWDAQFFGLANAWLWSINFPSDSIGFAVGDLGMIYKTSDGGFSWQNLNSGITNALEDVFFLDELNGYITGNNIFLKTSDGGNSWLVNNTNFNETYSLHFTSIDTGYILNENNIFKTTDGALSWISLKQGIFTGGELLFVDKDTGYVVGNNKIWKTINGQFWAEQTYDTIYGGLSGISFPSDSTGYIVGDKTILKTTNAGGYANFPYNDAGLNFIDSFSCSDSQSVIVKIKNYGIDTLFNVTIHWEFDGVIQPDYSWTGILPPGAVSGNISLDTIFVTLGIHSVNGWTLNPNSNPDDNINNDTLTVLSQSEICVPYDIGILNIKQIERICAGLDSIQVRVKNFGDSSITGFRLYMVINGTSLPVLQWNGMLNSSDSTGFISFSSFNFFADSVYYINVWTEIDSIQDMNLSNDSMQVLLLAKGLSGTYTIGGSSPDFDSIRFAVDSLISNGVCSEVIFNIRNGTYYEQMIIPEIIGSSKYNTITFQSESLDSTKVTITYYFTPFTTNDTLILLDGADNLVFKNLRFSFSGYQSSYECLFYLKNGADNNKFLNNIFEGNSSNTWEQLVGYNFSTTPSTLCNNNEFKNNIFWEGNNGLYLSSGDSDLYTTGTVIENNLFLNQQHYPIYLSGFESPLIRNNTVIPPSSIVYDFTGILLEECIGNYEITGNKLTGNFSNGIRIQGCISSQGNKALVANNMIQAQRTGAIYIGLGINATNVNIFHNTVSINSQTNGYAFGASGNYLNVKNNIFSNFGAGVVMGLPSLNQLYDYNVYYAANNNLIIYAFNSYYQDMAPYQAATGYDINSFETIPDFISSTNLHLAGFHLQKGTNLSQVPKDIEGDNRHPVIPFIGADEIKPDSNDVGITAILMDSKYYCDSIYDSIFVVVKNFGLQGQDSFLISLEISGPYVNNYNQISGLLNPGESDTLFFAIINTGSYGAYSVKAFTTLPGDTFNMINDSLINNFTFYPTPVVSLGNDTGTCSYYFELNAGPGANYLWQDSSIAQNIFAHSTGLYTVIVDNYGCVDSDSIVITFNQPGYSSINAVICEGDSYLVANIYHALPGNYSDTLFSQAANGCDSIIYTYLVIDSLGASFYSFPDSSGQYGIIVVNTATGNNLSYLWDFGDGNNSTFAYPQHTYSSAGSYALCLTIMNSTGCKSTYCDTIIVTQKQSSGLTINIINPVFLSLNDFKVNDLYLKIIPNPNNGLFFISWNPEIIKSKFCSLSIYNTLCELVFYSNVINQNTEIFLDKPQGIYMIEIGSEDKVYHNKLILK